MERNTQSMMKCLIVAGTRKKLTETLVMDQNTPSMMEWILAVASTEGEPSTETLVMDETHTLIHETCAHHRNNKRCNTIPTRTLRANGQVRSRPEISSGNGDTSTGARTVVSANAMVQLDTKYMSSNHDS
ncbi:hypothetical protein MPER_00896 [Moniliophthora perniciosa FA553]|nr:hypothetical protein MPER_00896 [Moniliophthora perniciosa FA553]